MGLIYGSAVGVFAWLGIERDDSSRAMTMVGEHADYVRLLRRGILGNLSEGFPRHLSINVPEGGPVSPMSDGILFVEGDERINGLRTYH